MMKPVRFVIIPLAIVVVGLVVLKLLSFTGRAPVRDASPIVLPGCPASPNCVCSEDSDQAHAIAPIRLSGDPVNAWTRLQRVVTRAGGTLAVVDGDRYGRYEFRSRIFGYVDDFECLLNQEEKRIEIRSASRSGYSDFGVNRRRVEFIRREFEKLSSRTTSPE